jgi:two-component system, cell cycle sensor histidine kinase and response regulator CckA
MLRICAELLPDAFLVADVDGRIEVANTHAEMLFGYVRGELLGQNVSRLVPDDVHELLQRQRARYAASQPTRPLRRTRNLRGLRKDGTTFPVDVSLNALEGRPHPLFCATIRDATERRRLEEQLRHTHKMQAMGQLAAGVAHNFNNLLTIVSGHAEMLLGRVGQDDPLRGGLSTIRGATERAAALTRQLLLFSHKAVLQPRVVDCNELVQHTMQMLRRLIGTNVTLSSVLEADVSRIEVDPAQLEQVIINLSINARDAMPGGGRLTIETRNAAFDAEFCHAHPEYSEGHYVAIVVGDTGRGMTAHVKAHLFEPFFTTKRPGEGTGLGLATVQGIVEESGGFITVSSEVDQGTTFHIYLPAIDATVPEVEVSFAPAPARSGHETVLIVDDESEIRGVIRSALERCGYDVLEAGDGSAALDLTRSYPGPIQLLVSDLDMPEMNGHRLADEVLRMRPRCRVLFMSGSGREETASHEVRAYPEAFIQKPFTLHGLATSVRELLDRPEVETT